MTQGLLSSDAWWTRRGTYKWSFPAVTVTQQSPSARAPALLFGDVDGDGRDDLIQAGASGWFVSASNGVDGWGNATLRWRDEQPADAERFLLTNATTGASAGAVVWDPATAAWTLLGPETRSVSGSGMGCVGSLQRTVSAGALWCLGAHGPNASTVTSWGRYDLRTEAARSQHLRLPAGAGAVVQLFVGEVTGDDGYVDAVVIDSLGNIFVAAGNASGLFESPRLVLEGFFAVKTSATPACSKLLLVESSPTAATFLRNGGYGSGASAMVVCVLELGPFATSWHAGGIDMAAARRGNVSHEVLLWKNQCATR